MERFNLAISGQLLGDGSATGRYVAVWQDDGGGSADVYGRLVYSKGTLDGSGYTIASESQDDAIGIALGVHMDWSLKSGLWQSSLIVLGMDTAYAIEDLSSQLQGIPPIPMVRINGTMGRLNDGQALRFVVVTGVSQAGRLKSLLHPSYVVRQAGRLKRLV
jgi:hypothetical protein